MRIAYDLFLNAVPTCAAGVDQAECGHALFKPVNFRIAVAFLFGKERRSIRDY